MRRYLNVVRNFLHLLVIGLLRSAWQLRAESKKAANSGLKLHVVIMIGGIGDIVASEPAVRAVTRRDEHVVMLARSTYLGLFAFNPSIGATLRVDAYLQALLLKKIFGAARWTNLHVDGHQCNMFRIAVRNPNAAGISADNYYDERTLTDVYSTVAVGMPLPGRPRVYPDPSFDVSAFLAQSFGIAGRPLLVVHTQATESIRSWPAAECRAAVAALLATTGLNVLELGLDPVLTESACIRQPRHTLRLGEQVAVMKRCSVFLGVDSGFSHVANALGLPSVLLIAAYKGFDHYLPWKCGAHDIVLRSSGVMREISSDRVVSAIRRLAAQPAAAQFSQ
jgi:heptosyltransferase-3